jgi:hypothetical protein
MKISIGHHYEIPWQKWRYRMLTSHVEWKPRQLELYLEDFIRRKHLWIPFYHPVQYVLSSIFLPNQLENVRTA